MMRSGALILVVSLVTTLARTPDPNSEQSWDALVSELRSMDEVFCRGCGSWFKLSQVMIASGNKQRFEALLEDGQPVVRCTGLVGLAQIGGPQCVEAIRSRLTDGAVVDYTPLLCDVWPIEVGTLAAKLLLTDGRFLGHSGAPVPMLSNGEKTGLYLEIAADDAVVAPRRKMLRWMQDVLDHPEAYPNSPEIALDVPTLRRCAPSLRDYEIVKAIGRFPKSVRQRDFLIACLDDDTLDETCKLAAASALTQYAGNTAPYALQRRRAFLNQIGDGGWGDRFIEIADVRKVHEDEIGLINAKTNLLGRWRTRNQAAPTSICSHPLVVDNLMRVLTYGTIDRSPGLRGTVANALVAASTNLAEHTQPWNTYASAAFELGFFVRMSRAYREDVSAHRDREDVDKPIMGLTQAECAEIERNIRPIIERAP